MLAESDHGRGSAVRLNRTLDSRNAADSRPPAAMHRQQGEGHEPWQHPETVPESSMFLGMMRLSQNLYFAVSLGDAVARVNQIEPRVGAEERSYRWPLQHVNIDGTERATCPSIPIL